MKNRKDKAISAFLGEDTEFEGKLTFHGTIRLDGRFKGEIVAVGGLIIGEKAIVEAEIHVSDIIICGQVTGKITAEQILEIHSTGKVFGNIQAPNVMMHPGAIFEGTCLTSQPERIEEEIA